MEIGEEYHLNNGDVVTLVQTFWHYQTREKYYLVTSRLGNDWVLSEHELCQLLVKKRTTEEKLALYAEYFAGRSDVYAQKWGNGKGYSPALKNWWSFYQLRDNKAEQAKLQKQYAPYTKQVIYQQISSANKYHRYGIYPLLKDDTTRLLVFDFDKHGSDRKPAKAVKTVLATCQKYGINCLPEISSSGDSYHLWIFFSQPIAASVVRYLGKLILMESMTVSDSLDLSAFDRMIPNQDRLPQKGFGNLIALPLKWSDVRENRSIFTNKELKPLAAGKLFDSLANTKRYSLEEVNNFIKLISNDIGILQGTNTKLSLPISLRWPGVVNGFIAGEIFIERKNLTRREQLSLLSLATFNNPEFVKKQRMRMPVWDTPSILTAAKVDGEYLRLPRGVLNELQEHCQCHLSSKYTSTIKLNVDFAGALRPEQQDAVQRMSGRCLGMISAHTGFGKTVVGCALIAERKARTLIIVPTMNIAKQWQRASLLFLKIFSESAHEITKKGHLVKKKKVEIISGTRNHPSKLVDIVNIRKLIRLSSAERKRLYQDYQQIIIDECHHISAKTFEETLIEANTQYIVGLTATPERKDGLEDFMYYRCGPILYRSQKDESSYLISRYIYPRYSNAFENRRALSGATYTQKIKELANNDARNTQIVSDVKSALAEGRHVLLLSERISHLKKLYSGIEKFADQAYLVTGGQKGPIEITNQTKPFIILSTTKYVGEGFDLPSLDTLFFTLPFSWKGNTTQYLGRLERGLSKKDELRVYDYVDIADETFAKMYRKRVRVYVQQGYEFVRTNQWNTYSSAYYNAYDYLNVWKHDLDGAKYLFIRLKRISKRQAELLNSMADRCLIRLELVKNKTGEEIIRLLSKKIRLQLCDRVGNNVCVFDQKICWYGDVNFGGRPLINASAIRLVSAKMAIEVEK